MHTLRKEKSLRRSFLFLSLAVVLTAGLFGTDSKVSAVTCPAEVLDLTNWKQTLPTGSSGSPIEITQTKLNTFTLAPVFQPTTDSAGVQFRAPVNGVTTSGSSYPRSELREMTDNGTVKANWSTSTGTHTMFIDQAITAVPKTKRHVVAGQIHDSSDDVIVIRLEYPKLFIDVNGTAGPTLDANYTLGKRFTVKFVATNSQIKVYYNGGSTPAYTLNKSASGCYFKAGAYTQSNCSKETDCSSTNYGEVVIYKLDVQHNTATLATAPAPAPTPTPTPTPTPAPAPTPTPAVGTSFEAEAGTVTAPMKIVSDAAASGGKYAVQTTDSGTGSLKYSVTIPTAGKYRLSAKVISPNGSSNSVYYSIDGGSKYIWNFPDYIKSWTETDGPTLDLTQGTHTLLITKREMNTKLDSFSFKSAAAATTVATSSVDGTQEFEAESGTVSGGMSIQTNDAAASGGKYVRADSSGYLTYQLNVPVAGTYRVAGWVQTAGGSSDSFYVALDSSGSKTWTLASPITAWTYDLDDGNTFSLSAGTHTLVLKYREAGAKIDKLKLVKQ